MDGLKQFSHSLFGTAVNPIITVAGTTSCFRVPAGANGGGISVREAVLHNASGTVTVTLVDMGLGGTSVAGTICAFALSQATRAPLPGTPASYYMDASEYIGVQYAAGTLVGPASIQIGYLHGK